MRCEDGVPRPLYMLFSSTTSALSWSHGFIATHGLTAPRPLWAVGWATVANCFLMVTKWLLGSSSCNSVHSSFCLWIP